MMSGVSPSQVKGMSWKKFNVNKNNNLETNSKHDAKLEVTSLPLGGTVLHKYPFVHVEKQICHQFVGFEQTSLLFYRICNLQNLM